MAYNFRVSEQTNKMVQAHVNFGTNSKEYQKEKETYRRIFEEEMAKDPFNGWYGWEEPASHLWDITNGQGEKEYVSEVYEDYCWYNSICDKYHSPSQWELSRRQELEERVTKFLSEAN